MQRSISIYDFTFWPLSFDRYEVTFESRATGKQWVTITWDKELINATQNAAYPKIKDLNRLKKLCKGL